MRLRKTCSCPRIERMEGRLSPSGLANPAAFPIQFGGSNPGTSTAFVKIIEDANPHNNRVEGRGLGEASGGGSVGS
jgi:hypothetical protein